MLKFPNNDFNRFIFFLRKGYYPYEHMYAQEKVNETTFPEKEKFYSGLKMEDITDADYMHGKKFLKTLK